MSQMSNECAVYIGNLPWDRNERDLEDFIRSQNNIPTSVKIVTKPDGRSRGFAFANFSSNEERLRAIDALNNVDFGGRVIHASVPKERGSGGGRDRFDDRGGRGGFGGRYNDRYNGGGRGYDDRGRGGYDSRGRGYGRGRSRSLSRSRSRSRSRSDEYRRKRSRSHGSRRHSRSRSYGSRRHDRSRSRSRSPKRRRRDYDDRYHHSGRYHDDRYHSGRYHDDRYNRGGRYNQGGRYNNRDSGYQSRIDPNSLREPNYRLYVSNINYRTRTPYIHKFFGTKWGTENIPNFFIPGSHTGRSKGYGFMTLANADTLYQIYHSQEELEYDGQILRFELAKGTEDFLRGKGEWRDDPEWLVQKKAEFAKIKAEKINEYKNYRHENNMNNNGDNNGDFSRRERDNLDSDDDDDDDDVDNNDDENNDDDNDDDNNDDDNDDDENNDEDNDDDNNDEDNDDDNNEEDDENAVDYHEEEVEENDD